MRSAVGVLAVACWCLVTAGAQEQRERTTGAARNRDKCAVTGNDPDGDCLIGEARIDYPELLQIPETSFSCDDQLFPGVYADMEANCQVFHVCPPKTLQTSGDPRFRPNSFICTPGLVFNQQYHVCDWWFNVDCDKSPEYFINNRVYYKQFEAPLQNALLNANN